MVGRERRCQTDINHVPGVLQLPLLWPYVLSMVIPVFIKTRLRPRENKHLLHRKEQSTAKLKLKIKDLRSNESAESEEGRELGLQLESKSEATLAEEEQSMSTD